CRMRALPPERRDMPNRIRALRLWLETLSDGDPASSGDQNTDIHFSSFLSGIPDGIGSIRLRGVAATGAASVVNGDLVTQTFTGGSLEVFDASNALLLSGTPASWHFTGFVGTAAAAASGTLFTDGFGSLTGGSLLLLGLATCPVSTARFRPA